MQELSQRSSWKKPERQRGGVVHEAVFEDRLDRNLGWALTEGSLFFEGKGAVQETLRKICQRLRELGIPYAVVGGMALFSHGLRRFTEDVDLLVTADALKVIHQALDGLGYLPPFSHSKNLRDTVTGVKIEFLITGGFPGDGKPKPVAFPDPMEVTVEKEGIHYLNLPTLIELKLASGMTNVDRMKDLVDVLELIKILLLPLAFADNLNPYVREKYRELWAAARPSEKRYLREKGILTSEVQQAMLADGVRFDAEREIFETSDPTIAAKYDMHDESEFMT